MVNKDVYITWTQQQCVIVIIASLQRRARANTPAV